MVQAAERSVPGIRKARREVLDGVYPPPREQGRGRVRDLLEKEGNEKRPQIDPAASQSSPPKKPPGSTKKTGPFKLAKETLPDIRPVEARKVRFEVPEDVEMTEAPVKDSNQKASGSKRKGEEKKADTGSTGRQSELTTTVDKQRVVDRILDTKVEGTSQYQSFFIFDERDSLGGSGPQVGVGDLEKEAAEKGKMNQGLESAGDDLPRRMEEAWRESIRSKQSVEVLQQDATRLLFQVWMLLTEWLRECVVAAGNVSQQWRTYKKPSVHWEFSQPPLLVAAPMNPTSNLTSVNPRPESPLHVHPVMTPAPTIPYALPFVNNPYESVQYLSRQQFQRPPPLFLDCPPRPEDALAAIQEVLHEQWGKYRHSMPIDVRPTFSAAPQSKYVGSYTFPDGQLVHRSVAMNNLEVLTDERTGLPYTITGHTVRDTFSVPLAADAVWPLELVYPSNERLHEEMSRCMQEIPDGDSGFPVHATTLQPPLPQYSADFAWPMVRTLQGGQGTNTNQICEQPRVHNPPVFSAAEPTSPGLRRFEANLSATVAPDETLLDPSAPAASAPADEGSLPPLPDSPRSYSTASSMPELVSILQAESGLAAPGRDIAARASQDLVNDDNLWSVKLKDEVKFWLTQLINSEASGEGLGICAVCFEPEHDPWTPCPPHTDWRAPTPPFMIPGHPPTPPLFVARQPHEDLAPGYENERRNQQAVHDMVHEALGPILEDFINMPAREDGAWDDLASKTREAREVFERLAAILVERQAEAERLRQEAKQLEESINARIESLGTGARAPAMTEAEYSVARALTNLAEPPPFHPRDPRLVTSYVHHPTVDPRRRRSESGVVYAGAASAPILGNPGDATTREVWSSSPETNASSESFSDVAPYARYPTQPVVNPVGEISPAVSEWSVSTSDFSIEPRKIIDEAIDRVRTQRGENGFINNTTEDPHDSLAQPYAATTVRAMRDEPLLPLFQSQLPTDHAHDLQCWAMEGAQCHAESLQWEDGIHGDPLRDALAALHGPLARFIDYPTMVSEGINSLRCPSPTTGPSRHYSSPIATPPDPTQSPTSLDFTLPTASSSRPTHDTMGASSPKDGEDFQMEPLRAGVKRSPPTPVEAEREARKKRKCRKFHGDALRKQVTERAALQATGLVDADVIRKFAGVRQACLEGARRIEGAVWARYKITEVRSGHWYITQWMPETQIEHNTSQADFPAKVARHPFFRDEEVTKLTTLYNVLLANERHVLASLVADVLAIRVRDEYLLTNLLNAGYLDVAYPPEENQQWWRLLETSVTDSDFGFSIGGYSDPSSEAASEDSSIASLEYPPSRREDVMDRVVESHGSPGGHASGARQDVDDHGDRHMDCDVSVPRGGVALRSYPSGTPRGGEMQIN
ncbi:hypothetical protein C8R47DRAFT_1064894 [Mycena vitilis]|nr:hypothetical protein C8R47DRAFT_1064894 [Mycena vitilis]